MVWNRKEFTIHEKLSARKEGKINLKDRIHLFRKSRRPLWWLLMMAVLVLSLYYYLTGVMK